MTWTSVGPGSGHVNALAVDPTAPSTLYAGTSGGMFKSTNGGASWTAMSSGLLPTNRSVFALAVHPTTPTTIYAGLLGGIYKSTDGAGSWAATNIALPANSEVRGLAIDPTSPTRLYASTDGRIGAGTAGAGAFRSVDGGRTWSAFNDGLTQTDVPSLAIDPVLPGIIYAGTRNGGAFSIDVRDPCQPRTPIGVAAVRTGDGRLQVRVSAGYGSLTQLSIGGESSGMANAVVDVVGGPTGQSSPFVFRPAAGATSVGLMVGQVTAGRPTTVRIVASDECGEWRTFVGGGPSAF